MKKIIAIIGIMIGMMSFGGNVFADDQFAPRGSIDLGSSTERPESAIPEGSAPDPQQTSPAQPSTSESEAIIPADIIIPENIEQTTLKEATFDVGQILSVDEEGSQQYFNDDNNPPIISFILDIINFFTIIIGSLAIIVLIIGGFMLMVAQGDQQKIDEGKDVIKYAIIGLIVTFLSYVITIFVQSLFITSEQELNETSYIERIV